MDGVRRMNTAPQLSDNAMKMAYNPPSPKASPVQGVQTKENSNA